jgi:1-acyl-sn-glycerol-3-phosphate acyltransferase
MIKANHHSFFVYFFRIYSHFMIKRHFREVFIEGDLKNSSKPILIISNHFSWWDGFLIYYLNNKLWQKKFHVMMLEKQLSSRKFLSQAGAFSIKPGHCSTYSSIQYAIKILKCPDNILLMYPQGEIRSQADRPVHFKQGAEYLIKKAAPNVKMIVVLTDYFSFRKPSLSMYIKNIDYSENKLSNMENTFNNFLTECINKQNNKATKITQQINI